MHIFSLYHIFVKQANYLCNMTRSELIKLHQIFSEKKIDLHNYLLVLSLELYNTRKNESSNNPVDNNIQNTMNNVTSYELENFLTTQINKYYPDHDEFIKKANYFFKYAEIA